MHLITHQDYSGCLWNPPCRKLTRFFNSFSTRNTQYDNPIYEISLCAIKRSCNISSLWEIFHWVSKAKRNSTLFSHHSIMCGTCIKAGKCPYVDTQMHHHESDLYCFILSGRMFWVNRAFSSSSAFKWTRCFTDVVLIILITASVLSPLFPLITLYEA